jgi:hypothetical protein
MPPLLPLVVPSHAQRALGLVAALSPLLVAASDFASVPGGVMLLPSGVAILVDADAAGLSVHPHAARPLSDTLLFIDRGRGSDRFAGRNRSTALDVHVYGVGLDPVRATGALHPWVAPEDSALWLAPRDQALLHHAPREHAPLDHAPWDHAPHAHGPWRTVLVSEVGLVLHRHLPAADILSWYQGFDTAAQRIATWRRALEAETRL